MRNNTLPRNIKIIQEACTKAMKVINRDFIEISHLVSSKQFGLHKFAEVCDAKAERAALDVLRRATPEYGVLCEQKIQTNAHPGELITQALQGYDNKTKNAHNAHIWIVDPIDGTSNFVHGNKNFVISIGLVEVDMQNKANKKVVAAGIYSPLTQEFFWAEKDKGAYLMDQNGHQISLRVSGISATQWSNVMAATVLPHQQCIEYNKLFGILQNNQAKIRMSGSTALDLAYMAAGRFDAVFLAYPMIWDWCAGYLIIQEAGGMVAMSGKDHLSNASKLPDQDSLDKTPLGMQFRSINLDQNVPLFIAANLDLLNHFRKVMAT